MENMSSKERFTFSCNRWLAKDEDDGAVVREIPAEGPGIKTPLPCKLKHIQYTCTFYIYKQYILLNAFRHNVKDIVLDYKA